jgi:hypothetical protein
LTSRADLDSATRVESDLATSMAARLVAVGVDREKLFGALSAASDVALATKEMLARASAETVASIPPAHAKLLEEHCAPPLGRDADGLLVVAVADPRTSQKLSAMGVRHRPVLAHEIDIEEVVGRLFPGSDSGASQATVHVERPGSPVASPPSSATPRPREATASGSRPRPQPSAPPSAATVEDVERAARRRRTSPWLVAALVLLVAAASAVGVVRFGHKSTPPVEDSATKQQRLLDEARAFVAKGDHAWAVTRCSEAVSLDSTSVAGRRAAVICDEQNVLLGEREYLADLKRIVDTTKQGDPARADAEAALKRLSASP